ncbi:hypothetical protein [Exiguobacterium artemiae]|uniref:hypothetical protein n=1 Tax=Exiguobacterium artemiae TaxID=340145 RepID=UPI0029647AA9|nr:hypothetical protein [Exiguobacterium sibiricum]MDW2886703.1 hypothetical protein [Exiguobacterium sibiricum]
MFRFNKGFNTTIIVLSILIVTATAVLIAVFPNKFELIFGTGTFIFVSLGMFVSLQSLDTATGARMDSEKSADATVASAESARQALKLAMEEAARTKERYRVENSSILKLHKGKMQIPLLFPFIQPNPFFNDDIYSKQNFDTIFLRNGGFGTATTIDVDVEFVNAHEFDGFKFDTHVDKDGNDRIKLAKKLPWKYPQYRIETHHVVTEDSRGRIFVEYVYFSEEHEKMMGKKHTYTSNWIKSKRIGTQEKGDEFPIRLPIIYRMFAHHFFMERNMIRDDEEWITPNPRLRVRVIYTEDILEHMNDHEEARRVKEFEISCNDDVRIAGMKEETEYGRFFLSCDFNIQTIFDRPLSVVSAEESTEEETVGGSTGPTEG